MLSKERSQGNEEPTRRDQRAAPLAATREKPACGNEDFIIIKKIKDHVKDRLDSAHSPLSPSVPLTPPQASNHICIHAAILP